MIDDDSCSYTFQIKLPQFSVDRLGNVAGWQETHFFGGTPLAHPLDSRHDNRIRLTIHAQ